MPRIEPLEPPYTPEIDKALRKWMPPGAAQDPLRLFRVIHRNPELASRMFVLGAGLLGHGSLPALDREIVIDRVCARTGCHYEWGVHVAAFAAQVGLTPEQVQATAAKNTEGPWTPRQTALLRAVDELHDTAHISDETWAVLREHYDEPQVLELLALVGWYHTISYIANALHLEAEPWATPFPEAPHR